MENKNKPLMQKEKKTKYFLLLVVVVLLLGYLAYTKLDIHIKDIKIFKDKEPKQIQDNYGFNNSDIPLNGFDNNLAGIWMFMFAIMLFLLSIIIFIHLFFRRNEEDGL